MSDDNILTVAFLASPSGLDKERRTARAAIDAFNRQDVLGCHIRHVGWEDLPPSTGRPQEIINRDVDRCGLFIGILHDRWGSPPDLDGRYQSGFEEEFRKAKTRWEETGQPEISLFFKEVKPSRLRHPDEQLQRVLSFEKEVWAEKSLLSQRFTSANDLLLKMYNCLVAYAKRLRQTTEGLSNADSRSMASGRSAVVSKPSLIKGMELIRDLASKVNDLEEGRALDAVEVARLRLCGSVVRSAGNDERYLGVHDANIIFDHRADLDLSDTECLGMLEAGLNSFAAENVPIWHWWAATRACEKRTLSRLTLFGSTSKRVGAFKAMRLIGEPRAEGDEWAQTWFSQGTPRQVKVAALEYLGEFGTSADIGLIETELPTLDSQTQIACVNAILRITLREDPGEAARTLNRLQPDAVDELILNEIFYDATPIGVEVLLQTLQNSNAKVRLRAVKLLSDRQALPMAVARGLLNDGDAGVRLVALIAMRRDGQATSDDEARRILVRPPGRGRSAFVSYGLLGRLEDSEGESNFAVYRDEILRTMSEDDLNREAGESVVRDLKAYLVRAEQSFAKHGDALRAAVDGGFESAQTLGSESKGESEQRIQKDARKDATQRGLEIICRQGDARDIGLVRRLLVSEAADGSDEVIAYLGAFGNWDDVALIVDIVKRRISGGFGAILLIGDDRQFEGQAADAMLRLGGTRLPELVKMPMSFSLLVRLIARSDAESFCLLTDQDIFGLLYAENDEVRKAAALKCVMALDKERLTELLSLYVRSQIGGHFYNVVHWLDLGVSAPTEHARGAASKELVNVGRG